MIAKQLGNRAAVWYLRIPSSTENDQKERKQGDVLEKKIQTVT